MKSDIYNGAAVQQYEGDKLQDMDKRRKCAIASVVEELLPFFERGFEDMDKLVSGPLVLADFGVSVTLFTCTSCFECLVKLYLANLIVNLSLCIWNVTFNCLPYSKVPASNWFLPGRKSLCPGGEENPRDVWLANDLVPQWQVGGGLTLSIVVKNDLHIRARHRMDTTTSLQSPLSKNQTKLSMFLQQVISYMIGPGSDVQNIWFGL